MRKPIWYGWVCLCIKSKRQSTETIANSMSCAIKKMNWYLYSNHLRPHANNIHYRLKHKRKNEHLYSVFAFISCDGVGKCQPQNSFETWITHTKTHVWQWLQHNRDLTIKMTNDSSNSNWHICHWTHESIQADKCLTRKKNWSVNVRCNIYIYE